MIQVIVSIVQSCRVFNDDSTRKPHKTTENHDFVDHYLPSVPNPSRGFSTFDSISGK